MELPLHNKVALVTGGARGIGQAICLKLASAGAKVSIVDILDAELDDTVAQINANSGLAQAIHGDVSDPKQVEQVVNQTLALFEHIDILVNNAGIIVRKTMLDTTNEDWQKVFGVNINGCFYCTRAVAQHMVEQDNGGHIINISSTNATLGVVQRSCYAATKGAIESFTRCCALELAPHGISVNAISPGFTITDINAGFFTPDILETLALRVPAGRVAEPHEVASAVTAIASNAMPYMIGQVIRLDGGWSSCDIDYNHAALHRQDVQV